jgi:hypothetical protein
MRNAHKVLLKKKPQGNLDLGKLGHKCQANNTAMDFDD